MRESVARLGAGGSRTKHRYEIGCVEGLEIESGVSVRGQSSMLCPNVKRINRHHSEFIF